VTLSDLPTPAVQPMTASPRAAEPRGFYAGSVLLVALLLSYTDRFILNLVVDPIRADLGLSDVEISLLQGVGFAIIFAVAGPPCGRLADSVNRRNVIAIGVLVWSSATLACALATNFAGFFAARLAVGLGEAALVPAASSLLVDLVPPRRRGVALGLFTLGASLGIGTALLFGGLVLRWIEAGLFDAWPLVGRLSAWRRLILIAGLPGFPLLLLLLAIAEPARQERVGPLPLSGVVARVLADGGSVLRVGTVKAALGIGDYGLIAWLPTLLQRSQKLTPLEAGSVVALAITASGALATVPAGALSDAFVRRWGTPTRVVLLFPCYGLTLVGALLVFLANGAALLGLAYFIWAVGSIGAYLIGQVVLQESVPNEMRATTIALSLALTALIGMALGPTLVPLVAQHLAGEQGGLQQALGTVSLGSALLACVVIGPPIRSGIRAWRARRAVRAGHGLGSDRAS